MPLPTDSFERAARALGYDAILDLEPHPTRLRLHSSNPHIVIQPTRDGDDYITVCDKHEWASLPHPESAPACPLCMTEVNERYGRTRYAEIVMRLKLGL